MAFGEASAGGVGHQVAVIKRGRGEAERAIEEQLAGSGGEEVRAAHDFGDAHGGVIHNDGELIGGDVIVTPDDEIAEMFAGDKLLRAELGVGEGDGFAIGNAEAPVEGGIWNAECRISRGAAGAGVDEFVISFVRRGGGGLDVLARAGAGVETAGGAELGESITIERQAFALGIGSERAATIGAFLPVETEPAQVFEHGGGEFGLGARGVEVFVAEDEDAVLGLGALLGGPKSFGMAEVKIAGGRRSETAAVVRSTEFGVRNHG